MASSGASCELVPASLVLIGLKATCQRAGSVVQCACSALPYLGLQNKTVRESKLSLCGVAIVPQQMLTATKFCKNAPALKESSNSARASGLETTFRKCIAIS
eukprot:3516528-Rhodomonas_salina.1